MLDRRSAVPPTSLEVEVRITGATRDGSLRFGEVTLAAIERAEAAAVATVEAKRRAESDRYAEERAFEISRLNIAMAGDVSDTCRCGVRDCWRPGIPWSWTTDEMRWFENARDELAHYRTAGEWIVGVERCYVWAARRFRPGNFGVEFRHVAESQLPPRAAELFCRARAAEELAAAAPRAALAAAKLQYPGWEDWTGWPDDSRSSPEAFAIAAYRAGHGLRTTEWYKVRTTESGGYGEYSATTWGAMVSLPVEGHADLTGECWRGRDPDHRED
jgi:hypothetical protein